jgi:Fic family protein
MNITKRQYKILNFIQDQESAKRTDIELYISSIDDKVSKITILRDLEVLLKQKLIKKTGQARSITYFPLNYNELLKKYDIEEYFKTEADNRTIKYSQFNFGIFSQLQNLFSTTELEKIKKTNDIFIQKTQKLTPIILKKEFERLMIELSWKSSQIEGNTYSLLDTEILIKENIEAKGHKTEEAVMILNHKKALDYIFENKDYFKVITISKLEELHTILTADMGVLKGLRKSPVGIIGTNYKPLSDQHQIKEAVERLIKQINLSQNPLEKALIAVIMISYIQPFEDGNKRTGRILANAILLANNYCPLSYRSIDEREYKKAVIIFYENNSLNYFKDLFIEQFEFAVNKYF